MIKELKYLFFLLIISLTIVLSVKYYFSDQNKKVSYRSLYLYEDKLMFFSKNLILLKDNTDNVIVYVKKDSGKNKKNYNFWSLINND
jgi:hypothetical protein